MTTTLGATRTLNYREAIREALAQEMARDKSIVLLGEDIGSFGGAYKVTLGLLDRFGPRRVRETPISEGAIAGAALGAALGGLRPCAEIMYVDMTTLAIDQIVNHIAKWRYMTGGSDVPVVIRTQGGAGTQAGPQHSQSLEAWYAHIPGLAVVMPATPNDAAGLLKTALRGRDPVIFIEHKRLYAKEGVVADELEPIPFGVARTAREGEDATIVATSFAVGLAEDAAAELESVGVSVEVLDPRTLKPLDLGAILRSVRRTRRLVVVHEANATGGFGAEIAFRVQERLFGELKAPIKRVCAKDAHIPAHPALEAAVLPSSEEIVDCVRGMLA
jgi:pyruvate/2-oxoglutarate/acetoin dehydrogenase E1 component